MFFYFYLLIDVYSRKIVGWEVFGLSLPTRRRSFTQGPSALDVAGGSRSLALYSDNGSSMKGGEPTGNRRLYLEGEDQFYLRIKSSEKSKGLFQRKN
jgi:transposase InsO family protein